MDWETALQFVGTCITAWVAFQVKKVHTAVNSERTKSLELIAKLREELEVLRIELAALNRKNAALESVSDTKNYDPR